MLRSVSLATLCVIFLSACASTPKASTLMTGISPTESAKTFPDGQLRLATDPVCETFYANAQKFVSASQGPGSGQSFLASLGLNVLSSVAAVAVPTSGLGTVGRVAARTATVSTVSQTGRLAVRGLNKASGPGAKIAIAAEELNCPVSFNP